MIAIVDYGMGNLGSIANMIKRCGSEAVITSDLPTIEAADKLILPGVGAFDNGMTNLSDMGLLPLLHEKATGDRIPILGICLGMQLLTESSEEGTLPGLGWIEAETVRFRFSDPQAHLKIPHMGWNSIRIRRESPLFENLSEDSRFYFVHSYHVSCKNECNVLSTTSHGYEFASAVVRDNIMGTQFHPEKSHRFGMAVLKNFIGV